VKTADERLLLSRLPAPWHADAGVPVRLLEADTAAAISQAAVGLAIGPCDGGQKLRFGRGG
jgi:hypothetical protein